ncbi:hypothetical protein Tco_0611933, partial [Tanacetum coccineum]
MYEGRPRAP